MKVRDVCIFMIEVPILEQCSISGSRCIILIEVLDSKLGKLLRYMRFEVGHIFCSICSLYDFLP